MDGQRAGTIGHHVEQSSWQKVGRIDKLHHSHETLQTRLFSQVGDKNSGPQTWMSSGRIFLLEICKIQNKLLDECFTYLDHIHLF